MDDVINSGMAWVTAFTPAATKTMSGQMANFNTTVAAVMRLAQRDTETEAHSHKDSVIVHPIRPSDDTGRAFNQAPGSFVAVARRHA